MSAGELDSLKTELLDAIASASDLGKLEEVRIAAFGRKGRVSELMGGLGSLPPEQRKNYGQAVNKLKESVVAALEARREMLGQRSSRAKLAGERADVTLPVREGPLAEGRIHPVSQVTDEIIEIFRRHRLQRWPRGRTSRPTSTISPRSTSHPSIRRGRTTTRSISPKPPMARAGSAHAHEPGADQDHADREAAASHHRAGARLSLRLRPDPHADVPSGRGAGNRRGDAPRAPEMGA